MVTVSFALMGVVSALLAQTGLPESPPNRVSLWTFVWLVVTIVFLLIAAISAPWEQAFQMGVYAELRVACDHCHESLIGETGIVISDQFKKIFHEDPCWKGLSDQYGNLLDLFEVRAAFVTISYDQLKSRLNSEEIPITFPSA